MRGRVEGVVIAPAGLACVKPVPRSFLCPRCLPRALSRRRVRIPRNRRACGNYMRLGW